MEKSFSNCNKLISTFELVLKQKLKNKKVDDSYYTGVDLGTAYIVMVVLDKNKNPIAGRCQFADVVKDGMVVDYIGAVEIVKTMKSEIENDLNCELINAAAAIPPGTELIDGGAVKHVLQSAGFDVISVLDEPTAANEVLQITNGAIVDIGGGTTGISIFEDGNPVYISDEATGGTHLSLVLAGAYKINYDEAERFKRDSRNHKAILPILSPVVDKIASIILKEIKNYDVKKIYLVGGTACLENIEKELETKIGIPVLKPNNPMFVTPLGIALHCVNTAT